MDLMVLKRNYYFRIVARYNIKIFVDELPAILIFTFIHQQQVYYAKSTYKIFK